MAFGLSMEKLPPFSFSGFRYFERRERHITRTCSKTDILLLVFEGTLRFTEDGVPVEVSAGEYYIQRKGLLQDGPRESDVPKYFFVHWENGEFTEGDAVLPIRGKMDFSVLFPLCKELETLHLTGATQVELSAVMYRILSILYKHTQQNNSGEVVAKVISCVTADIRRPISLDALASYCGYSKNHIINIFKRETGKTPYAYIIDMKLNMAKRLLLESESSQSSIAAECGFGGYGNFYRTFLKVVGCSPMEWKKRVRTQDEK